MRAELGPPTHELHGMHPDRIMLLFGGSRPLGAQNLTNTTLLSWLAYGYRCHPMPHQLEAFKIGRQFRLHENRLVMALIVASIVGTIVSIVGHVALYYEYRFARWGVGEFNRLQSWIIAPRAPNLLAIQHIAFGFLFTGVLTFLKRQFFMVAVLSCRLCCRERLGYRVDVVLNLFGMAFQTTAFHWRRGTRLSSGVTTFLGVCVRSIPRWEPLEFARGNTK